MFEPADFRRGVTGGRPQSAASRSPKTPTSRSSKPIIIISHGSHLLLILVLLGVLGGAIAVGFIGAFLGPTLLAIGFALIQDWSEKRRRIATS